MSFAQDIGESVPKTNSLQREVPPENQPFSHLKVSGNIISNINKNLLHRFWDPKNGIELTIESPFYAGLIEAGIILMNFMGKEEIYPDFSETLLFAGFGNEVSLPFNFNLYGGLRAGYFLINYNDAILSEYEKNESEFAAGINLRANYEIINNLFVSASSDFFILFTNEQLKFYYLSAGLAYSFNTPGWLIGFFE